MKYYTHEEMLETVVGKKGTKTRNEFETKLKAERDSHIRCRLASKSIEKNSLPPN